MDAPTRRKRLATMLKLAFYAAILAALAWVVVTVDWSELKDVRFDPMWFIAAIGFAMLFRYAGVWVWRSVLTRLGERVMPPFRVLADIYAKSWLARYIPGTVPWLAGKVFLAGEQGISKSVLAVSSVVESAAKVVASGAVSLILLALDPRVSEISPALRWLVAAGAIVLLLMMTPPGFNRAMALMFRLLKRGTMVPVGWNVIGTSLAQYSVAQLISGVSYVLVLRSMFPSVGFADAAFIMGAFGFAGVVGMLTPLVPSGLGTRDASLGALLLLVLDPAEVALIVIVTRVWDLAVDVLFWAVALLARKTVRPDQVRPAHDALPEAQATPSHEDSSDSDSGVDASGSDPSTTPDRQDPTL